MVNKRKWFETLVLALAVLAGASAMAADGRPTAGTAGVAKGVTSTKPAGKEGGESADVVKKRLQEAYPNTPFTEVRPAEISGIYEIVMGRNIAYTDSSGRYFFFGQLMDMKTQRNLTTERSGEISRVDLKDLRPEDAIKSVKGDGSRVLYVFADPNCGYCKQLEKTLAGVTNATIYTFLFPVLGEKSMKDAQGIWCSPNREKAWMDHMVNGLAVPEASCSNPIARTLQIGQQLGISGTPTVITAAGRLAPGAPPADRIEALLNDVASSRVAKGGQQ